MNTPKRILVTGSRRWQEPLRLQDALEMYWEDGRNVLVHGACPRGADQQADHYWTRRGGTVERHPADWDRYGNRAGPIRNAAMVGIGADLCLAFLTPDSRGAVHCAKTAERGGIPTFRFWSGAAE